MIMKSTLFCILSTFVALILTTPIAYGQTLENFTSPDATATQPTSPDATATQPTSPDATATQPTNPEGSVGKSEGFLVSDLRYRGEGNQITGTIINNSTEEKSSIVVYAVLFNKNDSFIDISQGNPLVTTLPPNDNSPFSIDLGSMFEFLEPQEGKDIVDHYTIYVKGYNTLY